MNGDRNTKLNEGNYNEKVGRNVIHAENVTIVEHLGTDRTDVFNKKPTTKKRLAFAIAGSIDQADKAKLKAIVALIQKMTGDDSIDIVGIEEGSIRLILEGSEEGLQKLKELFESGELTEVEGIPVEYVRFLDTETLDDDPKLEIERKSRLIKEIRNKAAKGRNLSDADLSDADLNHANLYGANLYRAILRGANLSGADLRSAILRAANLRAADLSDANLSGAILRAAILYGANLSGAKLSGAKLSDADLRGAKLSDADLSGAKLSDADLSGAKLFGANLYGANLSGARVENTRFGYNRGFQSHENKT